MDEELLDLLAAMTASITSGGWKASSRRPEAPRNNGPRQPTGKTTRSICSLSILAAQTASYPSTTISVTDSPLRAATFCRNGEAIGTR
jgi:hypothetical protein